MEKENQFLFGIQVDGNLCDACGACIDSCPDAALDWENNLPVLQKQCRVCGACEAICPNSALALEFAIE